MIPENRPVFFDPTHRRARWIRGVSVALSLGLLVLLGVFAVSIAAVPLLHRPGLERPRFLPDNPSRTGNTHETVHEAVDVPPSAPLGAVAMGRGSGVVGGFFVSWDSASVASLKVHAGELTHLFPGWLHLNEAGGLLVGDSDPTDDAARKVAHKNHLAVIPLINNYADSIKDFDEARLHTLLSSPEKRKALIDRMLEYVTRNNYPGVLLDLETERESDRAALAGFATELASAFHARGKSASACTQAGDPDEAAAIASPCDFIIPMLYDVHWASGSAGPIAPESWVLSQLDGLLKVIPKEKLVLALGNYAYDWERGKTGAKTLTFGEAMLTAKESRDGSDGIVRWDKASQNPNFTYEEENNSHDVWLLDGATAWNVAKAAQARGVGGRALWYLGSEDPTLWSFFGKARDFSRPEALQSVTYGFEIDFEGEGELLEVATLPSPGSRTLQRDKSGRIAGETWQTYPTACVLRRSGKQPKAIALTLDDGPDPTWTPQMLDALKAAGVPATFFVTGVATEQHPELARRAWDEGHELGNHSFYHPNLAEVGERRATLELDATQRAIQAAIGRSTTLFRPPYGVDAQPETATEAEPIELAQRLGYLTVAEGLDPRDWEAHPSADKIADSVVRDAEAGLGNIVLLHDSGGDRSETVKAIPLLVERLKAKGYRFVTVSQLAGKKGRDAYFPPVMGKQKLLVTLDGVTFALSTAAGRFLTAIFLFSLIVGALRTVGTGVLALRQANSSLSPQRSLGEGVRAVSVVIAAYNEEKVIVRTIEALLQSDYPSLEVIVVDDGSKDDTSGVVERAFKNDGRVRLLWIPNGGKARALNQGIGLASGEIFIGLDADTLFAPDAVRKLVAPFADPSVGAVAGNIQVGNRGGLWTRLQALEYTTSQNFDRRAFAYLNGIPVVPGCVGAWRRNIVEAVGGFQTDTLAEDADLTWRVRKAGWRIAVENEAYAFTEAPEKLSDLLKQRFRWTFGTLQVLWKHRDALYNPKLGSFGLLVVPSLWVFSFLLPALSPAADLGILLAALAGRLPAVLVYVAAFATLEACAALLAFHLERADSGRRKDLWLLPLQRILWRYLLLAVLWKALGVALGGIHAGWGKLARSGTAVIAKSNK